jgi:GntR family transcriptional activator of glc operon
VSSAAEDAAASTKVAEALGAAALAAVGTDLKSDRVAVELERLILLGELVPGARLPTEDELSDMFGASRSVIRDAVRRLVARGLLTVRQGRGTTVSEPNDAAFGLAALALLARSGLSVGEVISARAMLETALVPLAATTGSEEDWTSLDEVLDRFATAVDSGEWDIARDAHLAFHAGLLSALHKPALQVLLRPMTEVIWMSSEPPRETEPEDWEVETHPPILAALRERDPSAVETAIREHYAVLDEAERYGPYRSLPFSSVFQNAALTEMVARR